MNEPIIRAILALDGMKRALIFGAEIYEKIKSDWDNLIYHAALERQLEILSEASRRIPKEWIMDFPHINWRGLADIGNILRHEYRHVSKMRLYGYVETEFKPLLEAVETLQKRHDK